MDYHPLSIEIFKFIASAGKRGIRHLFSFTISLSHIYQFKLNRGSFETGLQSVKRKDIVMGKPGKKLNKLFIVREIFA